ncbi:MAG: Rrf2 family transcriptional regulator [Hyphomicrobium sp.]
MELTTRGRYAVMAMADLAQHDHTDPVTLSAISSRQRLSLAYLEQLFAGLRRAGLVMSVRGRSGGYRLARSASSIVLLEILSAVSEETKMTLCSETSGRGCLGEERCITHKLWQSLGSHIASFFSSVTLEEVVKGGPFNMGLENRAHIEKRVAAE